MCPVGQHSGISMWAKYRPQLGSPLWSMNRRMHNTMLCLPDAGLPPRRVTTGFCLLPGQRGPKSVALPLPVLEGFIRCWNLPLSFCRSAEFVRPVVVLVLSPSTPLHSHMFMMRRPMCRRSVHGFFLCITCIYQNYLVLVS